MGKLWEGRLKESNLIVDDFNSSIKVDKRIFKQDIMGSIAHASMLASSKILSFEESTAIIVGLTEMLEDLEKKRLEIDDTSEDIHTFVEQKLVEKIGEVGKKLHTARSRNDQIALDERMYLGEKTTEIVRVTKEFVSVLLDLASKNLGTIMPGYTHLQKAQPTTFAHYLMAYCMMFKRDIERFNDSLKRCMVSPIGSCALAGTTYEIDRKYESKLLGFDKISKNSMDGVSDRDFMLEFMSAAAILMMHISRLAEEVIIFSTEEYGYLTISDAFSTGSSIMPQKKNPDVCELVRGKTGRVYGNLFALLTVMKGLPLAYNKDMQEDKEALFDTVDTVLSCVSIFSEMFKEITINREAMEKSAGKGYLNATDLADYLTKAGMPFRDAYKLTGEIVGDAIKKKITLEEIPLSEYEKYSPLFLDDVYDQIAIRACVENRDSVGGPAAKRVEEQIQHVRQELDL